MPDPILHLSIITLFLSSLTIELLAEKISSWLAGLGDADRKNLNQAFKAICNDLASVQQKQLKKLDEAKINIFKAAVYPIARYYSDDEKLGLIKKQLVMAIISQLPEPQVLVDDFVSATYSRMQMKDGPFIQAILDQLLEIAKQREPQIFVRIFKEGESLLVQVLLNGEEIYRQAQAGKSFSEFKHDHFMIQTTTRRLVSLIARRTRWHLVLQEW